MPRRLVSVEKISCAIRHDTETKGSGLELILPPAFQRVFGVRVGIFFVSPTEDNLLWRDVPPLPPLERVNQGWAVVGESMGG
jgi:hypothetical protein